MILTNTEISLDPRVYEEVRALSRLTGKKIELHFGTISPTPTLRIPWPHLKARARFRNDEFARIFVKRAAEDGSIITEEFYVGILAGKAYPVVLKSSNANTKTLTP